MAAGLSKLLRQSNHAPPSARRKRHSFNRVRRLRIGNPDSNTTPENSVTSPVTSCTGAVGEIGGVAGAATKGASGDGPDVRRETNNVRFSEDTYASASNDVSLPGMIPSSDSSDSVRKGKHAVAGPSKMKPAGQDISSSDLEGIPQPTKTYVSNVRNRRVMKEFEATTRNSRCEDPLFEVSLVGDSLYEWCVKLFKVDPKSQLYEDMKTSDTVSIDFNIAFPDNFPFSPPFVRVTSPRIENGFVLDGGAICMELLTPQGWSSSYTVEAVILQLGATLVSGHARICQNKKKMFGEIPFNKHEAMESFNNIVETHKRYGWLDPPGELS